MSFFLDESRQKALTAVHVNLPAAMFDDYFDLFIQFGITPEIGLDNDLLDNMSPEEMESYAEKIRNAGLFPSIHAPFMELCPWSNDEAEQTKCRHYLGKTLEAVKIFQPGHVVWHTCIRRRHPYHEEAFRQNVLRNFLPLAQWFAESLNRYGARLMVENTYEPDCRLHLPIMAAFEPYGGGFCMDTGHSNAFSRVPLTMWLEGGLLPYLGEVHLHDNDGSEDLHQAPGTGSVDYTPLLRLLKTMSRKNRPLITLEPHTQTDLLLTLDYVNKYLSE